MSWKHNVIQNFDDHAPDYDHHADIQGIIARTLAQDLPDATDILEIGCGTGNLTQHLAQRYQNVDATDISPAMITQIQHKFDRVNASTMDAENPHTDKTYDLIVANMVVQWFETPQASINRLLTLLNPGGALYFTTPGAHSFPEWRSVLQDLNLPSGLLDFPDLKGIYRQEHIKHSYKNARDFLGSMKKIGAGHPRKNYKPLSYPQLKQACTLFDERHDGTLTWHIDYGCLKKDV